jgi:hypothetical protein
MTKYTDKALFERVIIKFLFPSQSFQLFDEP